MHFGYGYLNLEMQTVEIKEKNEINKGHKSHI